MRPTIGLVVVVAGCGSVAGSDQQLDANDADLGETTIDAVTGEADGDEIPLPFGIKWLIGVETDESSSFMNVAIDRHGFFYGIGDFLGDLKIADETVAVAAPFRSGYVAARGPDGAPAWTTVVPSGYSVDATVRLWSVAGDDSGGAYVAGEDTMTGKTGALLVKVKPNGVVDWRRRLGDDWSSAHQVAPRPDGSVVIFGGFSGTVDLGTGPRASKDTSTFVTAFSADGSVLWARPLHTAAATGTSYPAGSLVVEDDGRIYASGYFTGTVDFGSGPIVATHSFDRFLVALEPDGTFRWVVRLDGFDRSATETADLSPIAIDAAHILYVAGTFSGTTTIGSTTLTSTGRALYLASLTTDGSPLAASRIDKARNPSDLVADSAGNLLMVADQLDSGALMLQRWRSELVADWSWSWSAGGAPLAWLSLSPADPMTLAIGGTYFDRLTIGPRSLKVKPPIMGAYLAVLTLTR